MKLNILILLISSSILNGQDQLSGSGKDSFADYQLSSEKYITSNDGRIFMKINIWGEVGSPGSHMVYDGIDFASLLSIVGGPVDGANLKNVRLYREGKDEEGKLVYTINLDEFIKTGDRSNFIKINPNDTIIIPQKFIYKLLNQVNTVNLLFNFFSIYLQLYTILSG